MSFGVDLRALWHMGLADFRERVRSRRFPAIVAATAWLGWAVVPPAETGTIALGFGDTRGVYNSAWIGLVLGIIVSMGVALFAFYVVKDAIARDRRTGVGQILAATPLSRGGYLAGKWLSNVLVFAALLGILSVLGVVMQLVRGEDRAVDLPALLAPLWLIGLPTLCLVAAAAVLAETVPLLAGGLGNVAWFFAWLFLLSNAVDTSARGREGFRPWADPYGFTRPVAQAQALVAASDPAYEGGMTMGRSAPMQGVRTIRWEGARWRGRYLLERLGWVGAAFALVLSGALVFDRFDPSRRRLRRPGRAAPAPASTSEADAASDPRSLAGPGAGIRLTPLAAAERAAGAWAGFGRLVLAEVRLLLKGQRWWWYAGMAGMAVAAFVMELGDAGKVVPAAAFLWPVLVFSALGVRERTHDTARLVFAAPRPLGRQLAATWAVGVAVGLLAAGPMLLRFLLAGDPAHAAALAVAALFVPTLALALGTWSGSSRLFEIVYLCWWYAAKSGDPTLDFLGMGRASLAQGRPLAYAGLTLALAVVALLGRRRALALGR